MDQFCSNLYYINKDLLNKVKVMDDIQSLISTNFVCISNNASD